MKDVLAHKCASCLEVGMAILLRYHSKVGNYQNFKMPIASSEATLLMSNRLTASALADEAATQKFFDDFVTSINHK